LLARFVDHPHGGRRRIGITQAAMRALALVVALLNVPAFAADYTPWVDRGEKSRVFEWVEQAPRYPLLYPQTEA